MSPHEPRIQLLLEEILGSEVSAEDACRDHPELLPEITERLARARALERHIDDVFPAGSVGSGQRSLRRLASKLPLLPGYHVEGVLGCGGAGVVYRARHLKLNRPVAIKMLLAGGYAGPHELERFKREAESIAAIRHANIVQVFDAGECDGHPFFVMELVEGGSLAQQLDGHPRPAAEAAAQIATLARAVHAAHAAGIMHRDLKPANILLAADGTLKIADFGLARRSDQAEPGGPLTLAGAHLGTPSYMSPEQAVGSATGFCPLIDIYALGAILYELLTGRPPFRGESPAETQRQVLSDEPIPPVRLSPKVPRDLQTICLKCLQKDPARRYGSAADLADDLDRFRRGDAVLARPVGIAEHAVKWCRRRPAAAAAVAVVLVALASVGAGGVWLQRVVDARHTERVVRQESARSAIESSLPVLESMGRGRQWTEAAGVLGTSRARLGDAEHPELQSRLETLAAHIDAARELDAIRQRVPEAADVGYSFFPAREAYARVFAEMGIGRGVDVATAAQRIRGSPFREILLSALDNAAFTELFVTEDVELRRLLAVARAAAPDPWQDRFRDPATWQDLARLRALVDDARSAEPAPPIHQLVITSLLLSRLGANDATITTLREAQVRDPSDFWVNLELGNALERAGNRSGALQYFRTAVALKPAHNVAWTTLGTVLLANGTPDEAIPPLRRAVEIQPAYAPGWQNLVAALASCGQWDEAYEASRQAVLANPDDARLRNQADAMHLHLARAAAGFRDWAAATRFYERAAKGHSASDGEMWFEYAAVQVLAGNTAEHWRLCGEMLDRCEKGDIRKFLAARACTLAPVPEHMLARAARLGTEELDRYAGAHWSLSARGALRCREGNTAEAIRHFEESLRADQDPARAVVAWVWLARAHLSLGRPEAAEPWLQKAASWRDRGRGTAERIHLHDWLETQVLRHEVETALSTRRGDTGGG